MIEENYNRLEKKLETDRVRHRESDVGEETLIVKGLEKRVK